MLSYRHAFHAGNPADLLKHALWLFVLRDAAATEKPLYVLDTHAGAGGYDLGSAAAQKTGEFHSGIERLLAAPDPLPDLLAPYVEEVRKANPEGGLARYPGSPLLALSALRAEDRLDLVELHPTDHRLLAERLARRPAGGPQVRVEREDGLSWLVARMPPPERRAAVLIDPSYEVKSDYEQVARALARAWRRMGTGCFLLWYPVIERARSEAFLAGLRQAGLRRLWRIELCTAPDAPGRGMTGSGVVVVNPPPALPAAAAAALPWLARALGATGPCSAGPMV
ncbi:23S rRNA (adenine(2030)-N(6))-methyltransferase RlmJ [Marinimicrococcus flavescens]|uniref:Ribosomal RNA large subunit methyltransferase J n=1 Tax=Marinimicrococcus flavescens TaxID=3031815 RepID=A0AAP3UYS5_9PROT|nr:23S rRNA (adenine(2030)-N(6))-methyltransferase RlmJ [Marinimicrococcus flavescens]